MIGEAFSSNSFLLIFTVYILTRVRITEERKKNIGYENKIAIVS